MEDFSAEIAKFKSFNKALQSNDFEAILASDFAKTALAMDNSQDLCSQSSNS